MAVSLVKRPMPQGTMWVCTNCMILAVNGDMPDDPREGEPEPWAAELAIDVTPGRTDHDSPWCDGDGECECDRREFSWSACEGCGSNLGGSRHAFTYWA